MPKKKKLTKSFRFSEATFDFGGTPMRVQLVADPKRKSAATHITLLMGANGTCKSRILASTIDFLCSIEERLGLSSRKRAEGFRRSLPSTASLRCSGAQLINGGRIVEVGDASIFESKDCLPTRFLAIANLVRDRFAFVEAEEDDASRYIYLGVRQSSNMMTTGAMDRIAADAIVRILGDAHKRTTLTNWFAQLFPNRQLGIGFDEYNEERLKRLLAEPKSELKKVFGSGRPERWTDVRVAEITKHAAKLRRLSHLIKTYGQSTMRTSEKTRHARVFNTQQLPWRVLKEIAGLRPTMSLVYSLRIFGRPSLMVEGNGWMDFAQLSSGEQNLLATGARLIAYATPASFIAIDEPEVSLNVAWQQRYIELIQEALKLAPGSHILIASHSPYLVADLHADNATIVVVERRGSDLHFKSHPGRFWGWGSEAILYDVLGVPSASNYHFSHELASVLKLIRDGSVDREAFTSFLAKCDQLDLGTDAEPLKIVINEIRQYCEHRGV